MSVARCPMACHCSLCVFCVVLVPVLCSLSIYAHVCNGSLGMMSIKHVCILVFFGYCVSPLCGMNIMIVIFFFIYIDRASCSSANLQGCNALCKCSSSEIRTPDPPERVTSEPVLSMVFITRQPLRCRLAIFADVWYLVGSSMAYGDLLRTYTCSMVVHDGIQ